LTIHFKTQKIKSDHISISTILVIHTDLLTKVLLKTADVVSEHFIRKNGRTPCVVSEDMVMQMKGKCRHY
jgi:hypothetical protein